MFADLPLIWAGMAAPLPLDVPFRRDGTTVEMRLQAISFFLLALIICTLIVWSLWNYLRRDFTAMPRLSFGKALAGVILWGLLFFIVLTMISGARELMTPGAWKKDGLTYKLADDPTSEELRETRRQHLERLRAALWHHAATHEGRFPSANETKAVPAELWIVPESTGLRYQYLPGLTANRATDLLAIEPELDQRRWVLLTNGTIESLTSAEIAARRAESRR